MEEEGKKVVVVEKGQEEMVVVVVDMNSSYSLNFCLGKFSDGVKTGRTKCLTAKGLMLMRLIFVALKVCAWVFRRVNMFVAVVATKMILVAAPASDRKP